MESYAPSNPTISTAPAPKPDPVLCYYCKSAVTQDCCSTCGAPKGYKPR